MSSILKQIYELQKTDVLLAHVSARLRKLDSGETLKQAAEAAALQYEKAVAEHKRLTTDLHDAELELRSVEDKLKTFEQRLWSGTVRNPKELENLEKEVNALKRLRSRLDERVLQLMDEVEAAQKAVWQAQKQKEECAQTYQQHVEAYHAEKRKLETEGVRLKQERQKLAAQCDPQLLQRYEAIRQRHGGIGVSRVEGESCMVCHTKISTSALRAIKNGQIVQCENCQRLLYMEGAS
jgi:predicted  nucleic acid-binding Zn-ribbon protein